MTTFLKLPDVALLTIFRFCGIEELFSPDGASVSKEFHQLVLQQDSFVVHAPSLQEVHKSANLAKVARLALRCTALSSLQLRHFGKELADDSLVNALIAKHTDSLHELSLCNSAIVEPHIVSRALRILDLSRCAQLMQPMLDCPGECAGPCVSVLCTVARGASVLVDSAPRTRFADVPNLRWGFAWLSWAQACANSIYRALTSPIRWVWDGAVPNTRSHRPVSSVRLLRLPKACGFMVTSD